jgi:hypothetical protein
MSLGWALCSGSLGSALALIHTNASTTQWIEATSHNIGRLVSDFKWFTVFLLVGEVSFFVNRWRGFMFAAWQLEGRLKDTCLNIGSQVLDPKNDASRKLMFKIYRYVVLVMALEYKMVLPELKASWDKGLLTDMGLLTEKEAPILFSSGSRARDVALSWIALEVNNNGPSGTNLLSGSGHLHFLQMISKARGAMMYFWGNNFYPQPNSFIALMKFTVDIFCLAIIFGYPFMMVTPYELQNTSVLSMNFKSCVQTLTIICVFIMLFIFWGLESLIHHLHGPFLDKKKMDAGIDTFNIDALISGTEETVFSYLRSSFDLPSDSEQKRGSVSMSHAGSVASVESTND